MTNQHFGTGRLSGMPNDVRRTAAQAYINTLAKGSPAAAMDVVIDFAIDEAARGGKKGGDFAKRRFEDNLWALVKINNASDDPNGAFEAGDFTVALPMASDPRGILFSAYSVRKGCEMPIAPDDVSVILIGTGDELIR